MTISFLPARRATLAVLFPAIMIASALPAAAQPAPAEQRLAASETRAARQDGRIDAGVESGRINANEAARLEAQQTRIGTRTDRLASDGFYSRRDYASVSAKQRRGRQNIAFANRNRR